MPGAFELANYWANYIKTGNPNVFGKVEWTPYTKSAPKVLDIGNLRVMRELNVNPAIEFFKEFA